MKHFKILVAFLLLITSSKMFGQSSFLSIKLEDAVIKSKEEKKNIILYFTTSWCGPCHYMEKNVFVNNEVKALLEKYYIPVKVNGDGWYGEKLRKEYEVDGFPTFLFLDSNKVILKKEFGMLEVNKFTELINPSNRYEIKQTNSTSKKELRSQKESNKSEIGLRVGLINSQISNIVNDFKTGFHTDFFVEKQFNRFYVKPAISYVHVNGNPNSLQLLSFPCEVGLTFYKTAIFGLPGGFRFSTTPYYSIITKSQNDFFKNYDYGIRYGLAIYIGQSNRIEMQLNFNNGLANFMNSENNKFNYVGLNTSLTF